MEGGGVALVCWTVFARHTWCLGVEAYAAGCASRFPQYTRSCVHSSSACNKRGLTSLLFFECDPIHRSVEFRWQCRLGSERRVSVGEITRY